MNVYELEITRIQRKIKEAEERSDPSELKSYRIHYKALLKERIEQYEAWRKGKPFSDIGWWAKCLSPAMGFTLRGRGAITQANPDARMFKERARSMGIAVDNTCDSAYMLAAIANAGIWPMESINTCNNYNCQPLLMQTIFIEHMEKRRTFYVVKPFEESDANVKYVVDQLGEFIEFAEKEFPGVIKYDEAKLIEWQAREEAAINYNYEIFEMLKHKPSPISATDTIFGANESWASRDLEFLRALRDEVGERIEKGIGAVPDEKLRVIWVVAKVRFMDPFKFLAKRGVVVLLRLNGVANNFFPGPQPAWYQSRKLDPAKTWYHGNKLTPLEKEAVHMINFGYGNTGTQWLNTLIWLGRELNLDAIINHNVLGCPPMLGIKRLVEERAEKELGIPTLQLPGSRWDSSYVDEATVTAKLDEFVQMCLARKGLA